uniref:DUF2470 domain-containing protein n=1 Tax=Fagus sylvatica TaxID=28930 RepID=A0A2N9IJG4_FAGSY
MLLQTQSLTTRFALSLTPSRPISKTQFTPPIPNPFRQSRFRTTKCSLSVVSEPTHLEVRQNKPFPAEVSRTIVELASVGTLSTLNQEGWPLGIGVRFAVDTEGTPVLCLNGSNRQFSIDRRSSLHVQLEQCGLRTPQCTIQGSLDKPEDRMVLKLAVNKDVMVSDCMETRNGGIQWNPTFCKQGEDKMLWRLYKDVRFNFWSFYEMMRGTNCFDFPWKAIWQETVDPLLLHCPMAMEIWNFIFLAFGVNLVPGYLIWYIWRERNKRTFEGQEVAIQGRHKALMFIVETQRSNAMYGHKIFCSSVMWSGLFAVCRPSMVYWWDPHKQKKIARLHSLWKKRFGEEVDEDLIYVVAVEQVLQLEDFKEDGVWVTSLDYRNAYPDPLRDYAEKLVNEINTNNMEDINRFCNIYVDLDFQVSEAKLIWVDRLGFDMRLSSPPKGIFEVRIPFPREVTDEKGAKSTFNSMSQLAWEVEKNFHVPDFQKVKQLKQIA